MRIATWNINSVRLRVHHVLRFIKEQNIDVMCLQETKTHDDFFPSYDFSKIGMEFQYFRGEKSYNGVAKKLCASSEGGFHMAFRLVLLRFFYNPPQIAPDFDGFWHHSKAE